VAGQDLDSDEGITSINITPMVDIMLVLLVIFMVTTATIQNIEGMQVDKPDAETGQKVEDTPKNMLLVCHEDGTVFVDGERKDGDAAIVRYIQDKIAQNPDIAGIVQCDQAADVGSLVHLIDLLRENGVHKYAIATEKPREPGAGR
jgi:biopolymer transport protein ExbD